MSLPRKRVRDNCAKCGRVALMTRYFTGSAWSGMVYCRECFNVYQNAKKQRRREDLTWECPNCHKAFHPKQNQVERARTTDTTAYCSVACVRDHARVSPGLCRAPVAERCWLPAVTFTSGLCQAHAKRKERGRPIDTPVKVRS